MKKLLLSIAIFAAVSCTKYSVAPKVAHVSASTYFLFPGATVPVIQATANAFLPGDSAEVEYKGKIYKTNIIYQLINNDTAAHVISVKDVNGYTITY
jgi:hypothetical protein